MSTVLPPSLPQLCVQRLPMPTETTNNCTVQDAAFFKSKVWPTTTKELTISFISTPSKNFVRLGFFDTKKKAAPLKLKIDPLYEVVDNVKDITEAAKLILNTRIAPLIGIPLRFIPNTASDDVKNKAMIRIGFNPFKGSWSYVGTDARTVQHGDPTINFAWFDVATVLHEFCHALGMVHEHQNLRGGIEWDEEKVYDWAERTHGWPRDRTYRNIIRKYQRNQINAGEFDPNSIMLYYFPKELTLNPEDGGCHQNFRLSRGDVDFITQIYPGGRMTPEFFFEDVYGEEFYRKNLDARNGNGVCFMCKSDREKKSTPLAF